MSEKELTLSVIKADVGGFVGHSDVHDSLRERAEKRLAKGKKDGLFIDVRRGEVGDDIALIMMHDLGADHEDVHTFAWETFEELTEVAKEYGQYGAGQDLHGTAFAGNVCGMGPGAAEMTFVERKKDNVSSEPIIVLLADKTEPGSWNFPLYKIFCDPFNTAGLVIDPGLHEGFEFEIMDVIGEKVVRFKCPEEMYDMLIFIGAKGHYVTKAVRRKNDGLIAAVASTQRLALEAGRYIGKDDPVLIVRCQSGLPAVGEVLEPFAFPALVAGWMRGSHNGPLMPVSFEQDTPTRFDGPPRVVAYGFQVHNGKLIGPQDHFKDVSYDRARKEALYVADYMRRHGPFEPHRLPLEDMEYTTMPQVMEKLEGRFQSVKTESSAKSPAVDGQPIAAK